MVWWLLFGAVMFSSGAVTAYCLSGGLASSPVDPPRSGGRANRPDELRSMREWQDGLACLARVDGWHDPCEPVVYLWDLRVTGGEE